MPGVLIVEAFGQAAAALTAYGIDPKEYENKLVYLMSVEKARFRNPVIPDCELKFRYRSSKISWPCLEIQRYCKSKWKSNGRC